jgi:hypothetical protein
MTRKAPSDFVLAFLLLAGVFLWHRTTFPLWMVDLFHLQYAAYEFHAGETEWMYTTISGLKEWTAHREPVAKALGAEGIPNPDYYPPFLPALLSPFSVVHSTVWRNAVFAVNALLVFVFAWLIVRACRVKLAWRSFLWALALVLVSYPTARATKLGQPLPLLVALTWVGLLAMRDGRQTRGGVLLGVVTAIKIFPAGFLAAGLVERKLRTVIVALGTVLLIFGLSVLLLGWRIHELWWAALRDIGSVVYPFYGNQSPTGWFARAVMGFRLLDGDFYPTPEFVAMRLAGYAVFGGVTVWMLWWRRRDREDSLFVPRTGIIITGILLCLPVAWDHYWLFALPVLGWAIPEVWMKRDNWFWELWLAGAAFFFTMKLTRFYANDLFGRTISGSQTLGMILLWIWLVRRLWNRPHPIAGA